MATVVKVKRAASAAASLNYGELAVGNNILYFGDSSNAPVRIAKYSELPAAYTETLITTLVSGGTVNFSTLDAYDLIRVEMYFDASYSGSGGTYNVKGDSQTFDPTEMLKYTASSTLYVYGGIYLAGHNGSSYGYSQGSFARTSSTVCTFTSATSVTGVVPKLRITGINF